MWFVYSVYCIGGGEYEASLDEFKTEAEAREFVQKRKDSGYDAVDLFRGELIEEYEKP